MRDSVAACGAWVPMLDFYFQLKLSVLKRVQEKEVVRG